MDARTWKNTIKRSTKSVGTYQKAFDPVISTLSEILAKRDAAQEAYEAGGSVMTVEHTNKGGSANIEQSPIIRLINDLNRDALAYWKELGLTPAGLKRINEAAMARKTEGGSALEQALIKLSGS